jgi:general secretion pathway protein K
MKTGGPNRRGIALILVLLILSLITAVTLQFNRDTRLEVYEAANLSEGISLRYVAESGFYAAGAILLSDKTSFDSLKEPWANTELLSLKSEAFFDNGSFGVAIEDEGGKIAVNLLVSGNDYNPQIRDFLLRLLTGRDFGMEPRRAQDLIDAIKDWIDADNEVTGAGAEGGYYAGLPRSYAVKNAPLDCIEELLMIKGVTRDLFYGTGKSPGLVQCLTVFGDGKININTAPKPVLAALAADMTAESVEDLDRYRRQEKNDLADPGWYKKIPGLDGLNLPADLIAIRSDIFQIAVVGVQGKRKERITGFVKRETDQKRIKLLSWKVE